MNSDWLSQDPVTRELTDEQRFRAVHTVAHHAADASELAMLLDMLGLTAQQGRPACPLSDGSATGEPPDTLERFRQLAAELSRLRAKQGTQRVHRRRPRAHSITRR